MKFAILVPLLLVLCGASLSAQVQVQAGAREAMRANESALGARLEDRSSTVSTIGSVSTTTTKAMAPLPSHSKSVLPNSQIRRKRGSKNH
jgi:hypothetical protein